jgi:hypothetical protein
MKVGRSFLTRDRDSWPIFLGIFELPLARNAFQRKEKISEKFGFLLGVFYFPGFFVKSIRLFCVCNSFSLFLNSPWRGTIKNTIKKRSWSVVSWCALFWRRASGFWMPLGVDARARGVAGATSRV